VNGERGVLSKASLKVVSASDNSQQAHVGGSAVIGVVYQHFHFAADTLWLNRRHQGHDEIGWIGWFSVVDGQINQLCEENFSKPTSRDVDFDVIGLDLDAMDQSLRDRVDCLWSSGAEFECDAFRANQLSMYDLLVTVTMRGVEDLPSVGTSGRARRSEHDINWT
jgi:hypothetical protein